MVLIVRCSHNYVVTVKLSFLQIYKHVLSTNDYEHFSFSNEGSCDIVSRYYYRYRIRLFHFTFLGFFIGSDDGGEKFLRFDNKYHVRLSQLKEERKFIYGD